MITSPKLEYTANVVRDGFTNGNYPDWKIEYKNIFVGDISDYSLAHIANQIKHGFTEGEIQEDWVSGWWKLSIE